MNVQQNNKNEISNYASRDIRYEKYINKIRKTIPNLKKNVLLFLLINNRIDEDGLWLEFGEGNFNNTNHISHYTKNILHHFTQNPSPIKFSENVKIIEGQLEDSLENFKKNTFSNETEVINFLCINYDNYTSVYKILFELSIKLNNNCIIVFDKFINYLDYQNGAIKAFYDFVQVTNVKFEWIGMDGLVFKNVPTYFDGFSNTNNKMVGIIITSNPRLNKKDDPTNDDHMCDIFAWDKYTAYYSDLSSIDTKEDAWKHWITSGVYENRIFFSVETDEEKYFDWEKYIQHNDDLKELNTKDLAWQHWIKYGTSEKRTYFSIESEEEQYFDWEEYVDMHTDLKDIKTKKDAWNHWKQYGMNEGRTYIRLKDEKLKKSYSKQNISGDFDWMYYTQKYEDLSCINNELDAWIHWNLYGKNETRTSTFDWVTYVSNLELNSKYLNTKKNAFEHWLKNGKKNFDLPNGFSWLSYLIKNPDLEPLISTENDAKYHWLNIGQYENRVFR